MSAKATARGQSPYKAYITREPFLFYEMRVTARMLSEGILEGDIIDTIVDNNLFQYPTEKSIRKMARACVIRLNNVRDSAVVKMIAHQSQDIAKQACLYAMMKQHRLINDFMVTIIGEKYRQRDFSFGKKDLNLFFMNLQEQDEVVASWSDTTITKLKQIIVRILVETGYLDHIRSEQLNAILLYPELENVIKMNGDALMLSAFNCFE